MSFAREGYPAMAISGAVAITTLAVSVWRRSWSTWLLGFLLLLISAGVAWAYRTAAATPEGAATAARTAPVMQNTAA
jgi:cbb3-type cytochrome oxidase subunit 3